jgi:4-diphosphocytidyl-2-C-methyl-D-erythritol kinase
VNLFLAVGPIDDTGYHPIRTTYQAVSLFDYLTLEPTSGVTTVECNWPLPEDNTLTKTLRLMAEVATLPKLSIRLEKHIPVMSGLGGGSSDAAGLILGIASILPVRVPDYELRGVAGAVGADVPFFLVGGRAKGTGYGDEITPLPDLPRQFMVLVRPDVDGSTPEMYRRLDSVSYPFAEWSESVIANDFERVAPCECLEWIERLRVLGASASGLTGSGSAVFGLTESKERSEQIADAARREGVWAAAVETLPRQSPVCQTFEE